MDAFDPVAAQVVDRNGPKPVVLRPVQMVPTTQAPAEEGRRATTRISELLARSESLQAGDAGISSSVDTFSRLSSITKIPVAESLAKNEIANTSEAVDAMATVLSEPAVTVGSAALPAAADSLLPADPLARIVRAPDESAIVRPIKPLSDPSINRPASSVWTSPVTPTVTNWTPPASTPANSLLTAALRAPGSPAAASDALTSFSPAPTGGPPKGSSVPAVFARKPRMIGPAFNDPTAAPLIEELTMTELPPSELDKPVDAAPMLANGTLPAAAPRVANARQPIEAP